MTQMPQSRSSPAARPNPSKRTHEPSASLQGVLMTRVDARLTTETPGVTEHGLITRRDRFRTCAQGISWGNELVDHSSDITAMADGVKCESNCRRLIVSHPEYLDVAGVDSNQCELLSSSGNVVLRNRTVKRTATAITEPSESTRARIVLNANFNSRPAKLNVTEHPETQKKANLVKPRVNVQLTHGIRISKPTDECENKVTMVDQDGERKQSKFQGGAMRGKHVVKIMVEYGISAPTELSHVTMVTDDRLAVNTTNPIASKAVNLTHRPSAANDCQSAVSNMCSECIVDDNDIKPVMPCTDHNFTTHQLLTPDAAASNLYNCSSLVNSNCSHDAMYRSKMIIEASEDGCDKTDAGVKTANDRLMIGEVSQCGNQKQINPFNEYEAKNPKRLQCTETLNNSNYSNAVEISRNENRSLLLLADITDSRLDLEIGCKTVSHIMSDEREQALLSGPVGINHSMDQCPVVTSSDLLLECGAVTDCAASLDLLNLKGEKADIASDNDDDEGVYAESFRYSVYKFIGKDGDMVDVSHSSTAQKDLDISASSDSAFGSSSSDNVFYEAKTGLSKRTSTSCSSSSLERFRGKRNVAMTRKYILRHRSDETYEAVSENKYEVDRTVVMEKSAEESGYGFHLVGGKPMIVSTVESGSVAERSGVLVGDRIMTVNAISVVTGNKITVLNLIAQHDNRVELGLAPGRYVRDSLQCSGYLWKQEGLMRTWRRRWCAIKYDNFLYFYRHEADCDPLGATHLWNYILKRASECSRQFSFKLEKYGRKTMYFCSDTEADMNKWATAVNTTKMNNVPDSWIAISAHNVCLPALSITNPDCHGYLTKVGNHRKTWRRRFCVLKKACIYYYCEQLSSTAKGVAHLHGYTLVEGIVPYNRKFGFTMAPPVAEMRTFYFTADNETDLKRWIEAMRSSIEKWIKVDD